MAKILIIDDDAGMRQVISKILSPKGHTLIEAEDGQQAIELCQREKPDIALTDINLTDMDGSEILKCLKKINPQLPVIILSGFSDSEVAAGLVKQGGFDYILKPFNIDNFNAMVEKALPKTPGAVLKNDKPLNNQPPVPQPSVKKTTRGKSKLLAYCVAALIIFAAAGIFFFYGIDNSLPEQEFFIPYSNPAAISWDGKNIWTTDWVSGNIYQHNPVKMSIENVYKSSDTSPVGLTIEGANIWTCNSFDQKIYKHTRAAGLTLSGSYKSPGPNPSGLYYDGTNLWSMDFQQNKIFKHSMDKDMTVSAFYESPAANTRGMFGYKGYFYIADAKTNRIFKVNQKTFTVAGIYTLPRFEGSKEHFSGVAWDGKSFWICADGIQKIFRFPLKSLKPVKFS